MMLPCLVIAESKVGGRGVFTTTKLKEGEIVEISPVLVFDPIEREHIEKTLLYNYIFEWGEDGKQAALGLGYLSMYNHSQQANCDYEMDFEHKTMKIITYRKINVGEELFINYNADPDNANPVWFDYKE